MRNVVVARDVGKKYRIGVQGVSYSILREKLTQFFRSGFRRNESEIKEFWALRGVSAAIGEAEVVGLVGKNGAGKSTLLKILSQITEPTEGEVHIYGKVASLLEVGIGFHPELSGRENIFLNGAILGMSRSSIREKFDEIVAFAEIERFLDTPVKRYSSGMYVRLAFAVAAHLDSEILIVDEVLAVGDAAFQQKCLGRMRSIRSEGRSVILVSHNMATVSALCQRVIWIDEGRVKMDGDTRSVLNRYLSEGRQNDLVWSPRHATTEAFQYVQVFVTRGDDQRLEEAFPGNVPIDIVFEVTINQLVPPGRIELRLMNHQGEILLTSTSADRFGQRNHEWQLGPQRFRCRIPPYLLAPGHYFLGITEPCGSYDLVRDNVLNFSVSEQDSLVSIDNRQGRIAPMLDWVNER